MMSQRELQTEKSFEV